MDKSILHAAFFIFIFTRLVSSQVNQDWVARYNGPANNNDIATSIAVDGAGNVYVTGYSAGVTSNYDYATIKYNSSGVQQWLQRYDGTGGTDDARGIAVDNSGNIYVTGWSWGGTSTTYDYTTIKYNSLGVQQWVQRYDAGFNENDNPHALAIDHAGNIYVTGESWTSYPGFCTIKYSPTGYQIWIQRYDNDAAAYAIAFDNSDNVYVTGEGYFQGFSNDYVTIKYDSSGSQQWFQRYNGPGANSQDFAYAIAVDVYGNSYITGTSGGAYATVKYNSSGVQQWVQRYSAGYNNDVARGIVVDSSGNVYVTGESFGYVTHNDYATIKYNSSGVQQWVQRWSASPQSDDHAYCIALDGYANVYVTGYTLPGSGSDENIATIKYNTNGVQVWTMIYNGPGTYSSYDIPHGLIVDNAGNIYITGESDSAARDYITIKYSQVTGIQPVSSDIPISIKLYQNYPNPFNPATKIKFSIPASPVPSKGGVNVKLIVYDILGREVASLISPLWGGQEGLKPGSYEVEWDGTNYPSGVYFYKLIAGEFNQTKRMILMK